MRGARNWVLTLAVPRASWLALQHHVWGYGEMALPRRTVPDIPARSITSSTMDDGEKWKEKRKRIKGKADRTCLGQRGEQ